MVMHIYFCLNEIPMIKSSHQPKMSIWGLASPNFVSMRPLKNKLYTHEFTGTSMEN